jgi:hypothetical protein
LLAQMGQAARPVILDLSSMLAGRMLSCRQPLRLSLPRGLLVNHHAQNAGIQLSTKSASTMTFFSSRAPNCASSISTAVPKEALIAVVLDSTSSTYLKITESESRSAGFCGLWRMRRDPDNRQFPQLT